VKPNNFAAGMLQA